MAAKNGALLRISMENHLPRVTTLSSGGHTEPVWKERLHIMTEMTEYIFFETPWLKHGAQESQRNTTTKGIFEFQEVNLVFYRNVTPT